MKLEIIVIRYDEYGDPKRRYRYMTDSTSGLTDISDSLALEIDKELHEEELERERILTDDDIPF